MTELNFSSEHMRYLIEKMRAVGGWEDEEITDQEADDEGDAPRAPVLEENAGDLMAQELREEIEALDDEHQAELVALMWVGRGDFVQSEWQDARNLAQERRDGPTWRYLMSHPRSADQIASGLEELGHSHVLQDGVYDRAYDD